MNARAALDAAMSEAALQDAIVRCARFHGWLAWHDTDSRRNDAGWPDLVLVHPARGDLIAAELKTERGQLRPEQRRWLAALRAVAHERGITVVVWRPHDWSSGQIERRLKGE